MPVALTTEYLPPGTLLGSQYRLIEIIGEGGMGVIYRARQELVGRDVAVKILRGRYARNETIVRRFENEARIISQLRHPNTIRLYDCQRTGGSLFIVTEFLHGQSLYKLLRHGPLPIDRAVRIGDQICGSLSEAHAAGVVHRDLKPENIFLDRVGKEDHVKVLDFGIAKLAESESFQTQSDMLMGTPAYMSPEQAAGDPATTRSDIYALGILLFQMISGKPPFSAHSPVALLLKHINEPTPSLAASAPHAGVPPELEGLVMRLLSKSPAERVQSVDEIRERLNEIALLRLWSTPSHPWRTPAPPAPMPAPPSYTPRAPEPALLREPPLSALFDAALSTVTDTVARGAVGAGLGPPQGRSERAPQAEPRAGSGLAAGPGSGAGAGVDPGGVEPPGAVEKRRAVPRSPGLDSGLPPFEADESTPPSFDGAGIHVPLLVRYPFARWVGWASVVGLTVLAVGWMSLGHLGLGRAGVPPPALGHENEPQPSPDPPLVAPGHTALAPRSRAATERPRTAHPGRPPEGGPPAPERRPAPAPAGAEASHAQATLVTQTQARVAPQTQAKVATRPTSAAQPRVAPPDPAPEANIAWDERPSAHPGTSGTDAPRAEQGSVAREPATGTATASRAVAPKRLIPDGPIPVEIE